MEDNINSNNNNTENTNNNAAENSDASKNINDSANNTTGEPIDVKFTETNSSSDNVGSDSNPSSERVNHSQQSQNNNFDQSNYEQSTNASNGNNNSQSVENVSSNDYVYGIIAYVTWIGFIIAICCNPDSKRSEYLKFRLNQAFVINLFDIISIVPIIGKAWGLFMFVIWLIALIFAFQKKTNKLLFFDDIHIFN